jgi:hypothetical protein
MGGETGPVPGHPVPDDVVPIGLFGPASVVAHVRPFVLAGRIGQPEVRGSSMGG